MEEDKSEVVKEEKNLLPLIFHVDEPIYQTLDEASQEQIALALIQWAKFQINRIQLAQHIKSKA